MMKLVWRSRPLPITQVKYEARYEEFVTSGIKSQKMETLRMHEAVSGDSNIGDDEEIEPVAAIAAHLADIISDSHAFSSKIVC